MKVDVFYFFFSGSDPAKWLLRPSKRVSAQSTKVNLAEITAILGPFWFFALSRGDLTVRTLGPSLVQAAAAQTAPCCNPHVHVRWWLTPRAARGLRIFIFKGKGGTFARVYAESSTWGLWSRMRFPSYGVVQTNNNNREWIRAGGGGGSYD